MGLFNFKKARIRNEALIDVRSPYSLKNHLVSYENYIAEDEAICGYVGWLGRGQIEPNTHWLIENSKIPITSKFFCNKCVSTYNNQ